VTELKKIGEREDDHDGHDELKEKPKSVTENHKINDDDEIDDDDHDHKNDGYDNNDENDDENNDAINDDDGNDEGNDDGSSGDDSITQKSQHKLSTLADDEDLTNVNAKMTTQKPETSTQISLHSQNNPQNPQLTPQTHDLIIEASKVYKITKNTRKFLCRRCKIKINQNNQLEIINDPTSADDDSEYQHQHHQTPSLLHQFFYSRHQPTPDSLRPHRHHQRRRSAARLKFPN
jgi:hypothetical protein